LLFGGQFPFRRLLRGHALDSMLLWQSKGNNVDRLMWDKLMTLEQLSQDAYDANEEFYEDCKALELKHKEIEADLSHSRHRTNWYNPHLSNPYSLLPQLVKTVAESNDEPLPQQKLDAKIRGVPDEPFHEIYPSEMYPFLCHCGWFSRYHGKTQLLKVGYGRRRVFCPSCQNERTAYWSCDNCGTSNQLPKALALLTCPPPYSCSGCKLMRTYTVSIHFDDNIICTQEEAEDWYRIFHNLRTEDVQKIQEAKDDKRTQTERQRLCDIGPFLRFLVDLPTINGELSISYSQFYLFVIEYLSDDIFLSQKLSNWLPKQGLTKTILFLFKVLVNK